MKKHKQATGRPNRPVTPISTRLEEIREMHGIGSLSEFRRRLTQAPTSNGKPYKVSDSAVRNYQFGLDPEGTEREPPYSYLARVCEVFPRINPTWLLTGEGDRERATHEAKLREAPAEEGQLGKVRQAIRDEFGRHGVRSLKGRRAPKDVGFPPGEDAVLDAWSVLDPLLSAPQREGEGSRPLTDDESVELARTLVRLVVMPATVFGIDLANLRGGILLANHYVTAACHALVTLMLADGVVLYSSPATWAERHDLFAYLSGERKIHELEPAED